jgi:hypothetical protein
MRRVGGAMLEEWIELVLITNSSVLRLLRWPGETWEEHLRDGL